MKKLSICLAAAALVLASCAKDEVMQVNSQSPDVIGFSSGTSRAAINDLAALQGASAGFKVYGQTNSATVWYTNVDGTNNYAYSSPTWGWAGTAALWPTVASDYPMDFYAMYPVVALTDRKSVV